MEKLQRKKNIIISIYALILILIIASVYFHFKPKVSCSDGIKNQNEEDMDCGGSCPEKCEKIEAQKLIVEKTGAVPAGISGQYDFYAIITNPNAVFGCQKFDYSIKFKDGSGNVIASRNGSSFILPGERKYIVENNIGSSSAESFDFEILTSEWLEFFDYEKPDIQIINKNYTETSGGAGFSEATGLLKNESSFDFDLIRIQIILKNESGEVLALNSTQMKTIKSGERRDFKTLWPSSFPGVVGNMEAQAEVNVFDSETFLKRFYKAEKFQQ